MIELLFYTSMSCVDTAEMLERVEAHDWLSNEAKVELIACLLYTSPSPRDVEESRMPSSA